MKKFKLCHKGVLLLMTALLLAGCSSKEKEPETDPADKVYPVTIQGTEIIVGETNVSSLLDAGFNITVSEMDDQKNITVFEIDPTQELEANSYYSGGTLRQGDTIYGKISLVTEEAVPMGQAVIARLEMDGYDYDKSTVTLAGVPLDQMTGEKAKEVIADLGGDEYMMFHSGDQYETFLSFDMEGAFQKFSIEKEYDVDWTTEE